MKLNISLPNCVNLIHSHTKLKILYFIYCENSLDLRHRFSVNSLHRNLRYSQMIHCYASVVSLIIVRI